MPSVQSQAHQDAIPADGAETIEITFQALASSELADGLDNDQFGELASISQLRTFAPGETICGEHEQSDELYIISSGGVEVWLDPASVGDTGNAPRKIALLQAGQACGELALIDGGVRSAGLQAGPQGARLVAFSRAALLGLCETNTAIGYRLMRNLAGALALRLRLQDMRLYSGEL